MVLMTYSFRKSFELYLISLFFLRFRPYFHYYCFLLLPSTLLAGLGHPNKMFGLPIAPTLLMVGRSVERKKKGSGFQRRPGC